MRMTNEQFQAEVFRRSEAYRKRRQTACRRYLTAGAIAFAGCFVLAFAVLKRPMYDGIHSEMMAADDTAGENGAWPFNGVGDSEEAAAENAEEVCVAEADGNAAPSVQGGKPNRAEYTDKITSDTTQESAETPLTLLGLSALPGQLGGCALDEHSQASPYLYSDGDRWMEVRLSIPAEPESENSVQITYENTADGERLAWFLYRGVRVQIYAAGCSYAQLESAAEELLTYLKQEGSQ